MTMGTSRDTMGSDPSCDQSCDQVPKQVSNQSGDKKHVKEHEHAIMHTYFCIMSMTGIRTQ